MACKFRIRKPKSLESVSSRDSGSTAASTSMPRTPVSPTHNTRDTRIVEFDSLHLHPTHHAPPRLADRAFIHPGDRDDAPKYFHQPQPRRASPPILRGLEVPLASSPQSTNHDRGSTAGEEEGAGYFTLKFDMLQRPTLARSRWSESTISTLSDGSDEEDVEDDIVSEDEDMGTPTALSAQREPTKFEPFQYDDAEREVKARSSDWQNFSLKRNTVAVARRRPLDTGNSIDNYVKRGGWKRRGIVFQNKDESCITERLSSRTVG